MAQLDNSSYHTLVEQIGNLLKEGRNKAYYAVNTILVETYWNIGKYIFEYELKGNQRAEYGEGIGEAFIPRFDPCIRKRIQPFQYRIYA